MVRARKPEETKPDDDSIFVSSDSPYMVRVRAELKKRQRYVKPLEEVRRILDAELGDVNLSDEVIKMRRE